jgi:hypothetical protein
MAQDRRLKDLEDRLNRDARLRNEFLKDPVRILKREGVELAPEMARSVREQFKDLQLPKLPKVRFPKIVIKISIGIKF